MFNNNKKLMLINLSNNKIHDFNLQLNKFTMLEMLYLNNNLLNVLDEFLFKEFIMKSRRYLMISHNKFACYCDMYWLASMQRQIKSQITLDNNICSSSKIHTTSLECFIKNKTGSGNCNNLNLPTCIKC